MKNDTIISFEVKMEKLNLQEKRKHSSQLVPFSYYECLIPDYFANVPVHWHSEFEINYVISGKAELICNDKRITTQTGDIILITPDKLHAFYSIEGCQQRYDTIVFSSDMLGVYGSDRSCVECVHPLVSGAMDATLVISKEHDKHKELEAIVKSIFYCAKENTPLHDFLMKSELIKFFWLLFESGDLYCTNEKAISKSEVFRPILEYMHEKCQENITVDELADIACMSRSYFMKRFREVSGVGAIEYLTQIRIKKACNLLAETELSVLDISLECGFKNLSNFNRQFKKKVGCTPREYRSR